MSGATQGAALVRVELTYSDGSRAWLADEEAQRWSAACSAVVQSAWARGVATLRERVAEIICDAIIVDPSRDGTRGNRAADAIMALLTEGA